MFGDQVNFDVSPTAMVVAAGSVTALLKVVIAGPVSVYEVSSRSP